MPLHDQNAPRRVLDLRVLGLKVPYGATQLRLELVRDALVEALHIRTGHEMLFWRHLFRYAGEQAVEPHIFRAFHLDV
jgi:hypothetical protein